MSATQSSLTTVAGVDDVRAAVRSARQGGRRVGFVPTMGALHDGHAGLIRAARAECDVVVVSCYVNPLQFGAGEDLDRYPHTPDADAAIVGGAGADLLWRPAHADLHGRGPDHGVRVLAGPLGGVLEGAARPGHFDGVATVVTQLLGAVEPDVLYLGAKDYQQLLVLRRVVAGLLLDVDVRAVETVREPDGLARSSRNTMLAPAQRAAASSVPRALQAAQELARSGERSASELRSAAVDVLATEPLIDVDYVVVADPESLMPLDQIAHAARMLVAVRIGSTRLIDNVPLPPPAPRKIEP